MLCTPNHYVPPITTSLRRGGGDWPSYYDGSLDKAISYHGATATRGGVPTCLVAVQGGLLAGTISLLIHDLPVRPQLNPWLGALYVNPSFRRLGIARRLVEACMKEAKKAGLPILYVWTKQLRPLFESLDWSHQETLDFLGSSIELLLIEPKSLFFSDL